MPHYSVPYFCRILMITKHKAIILYNFFYKLPFVNSFNKTPGTNT